MHLLHKMTNKRRDKLALAPGRPVRRLAGGWVTDMAELEQCIMLCDLCAHKFDHRKYGYEIHAVLSYQPKAIGTCDGCKRFMIFCTMFLISKER